MRRGIYSVAITDPLVKYQSLLATGLCSPDAAQHRLAIHLQKVYHRLKDYSPSGEYRERLRALASALDRAGKEGRDTSHTLASERHPIRRNPLLARFFAQSGAADTLALVRVLTSHEEAIRIDSPQGLFLSGEVGTGKSMLLDLLADGLPTSRKRRWHFSTFMLHTLSQLERYRKSHRRLDRDDQEYSLLWLAKDMVEKSPILFLDEFQLPDKAAAKIMSNLFIAFFQLGGVLVASSNRMPDELEKAAGVEYASSAAAGVVSRVLGIGRSRRKGELFGATSDFASFLDVLKARCEFWQMEGAKDWRRHEASASPAQRTRARADSLRSNDSIGMHATGRISDTEVEESTEPDITPTYYFLVGVADESSWASALDGVVGSSTGEEPAWESSTLVVYGRAITIPRHRGGTVSWHFDDLVSSFGPADYITMASTFHTFVIDGIPTLTVLKKNEARRLITLLDALYEARCKLVVRAAAGPDDLFFPEARPRAPSGPPSAAAAPPDSADAETNADADAIHSETVAEAYQDTVSPFRPNVSSYGGAHNADYDPDQDSGGRARAEPAAAAVDFSDTGAFTGEDERFAYKRAASRLWELCGARWHARTGDWWRPLPREARHWEGGAVARPVPWTAPHAALGGDVTMGPSVELDELAGLQRYRLRYLRRTMLEEQDTPECKKGEKG
ncbi:AFG1-like ATPase-domain-containing protein [Durotheca rogersii]|uniref:AFG1-like ATPase-domain-containing protein n=1 Tax=Durotheca rogersii TaxID=419775 RepID=UPI00221E6F05|nr:AFG1-like ATPase-domain-containing protein [Durotheca rogersii]KAI5860778.1 AFG1-like ATPase-domain-containing protein [Durotheca rogersii]